MIFLLYLCARNQVEHNRKKVLVIKITGDIQSVYKLR